jgi:hypothetical protein
VKRNLLLLSSTLLLLNTPVRAAEGGAVSSSGSKSATNSTVTNSAPAESKAKKKGGLAIPPPPKETLPGHTGVSGVIPDKTGAKPAVESVKMGSQLTTVGAGGPYTSKNERVQRFADYIELKPGMETAPLTLTITNKGFKWFRMMVANQVVATEKSLNGRQAGDLDLTGVIQPGTNQVVIQAGGNPGAVIDWKVTTLATAKLEKVDPDETLVGDAIKIKGKNFGTTINGVEVMFNSKKGQVQNVKPTELTVKVPMDAELGENKVGAKVNGLATNTLKIKLRGIPQVTGTNLQGVPPGQQLIVFGKNFSKTLSENKVFIGEAQAPVISGDTSQLVVVVPNMPYTEGHTPSAVSVTVGKIKSKSTVPVQVGPQMFTEPGLGGTEIPTFSPRNQGMNNM